MSGAPRLLILTQYFPPEMGAPQVRLSELGEQLIDRGWEVEALTALPNYPTGRVFEGYAPRRTRIEQVGRIRAVRVPLIPAKSGMARRMVSYFSFVAAARWYGPRLCRKPDLMLVESPPLFIGYAALGLSRRFGCPFVFNVSDLWPEAAIRMGVIHEGFLTRQARRLERSLYRQAAGVTGQSEEIIEGVERAAPGTRSVVITNGVDPARFGPEHADKAARELIGWEPGPVFMFAGLLGLAQGLDNVLEIARTWPANQPGRFVLIGDGPERERLAQRIIKERIERVKLLPAQPRNRIPALLASADAAVISLSANIFGSVPSKIYEAMASRLPILLLAEGEAERRVAQAGCGLHVRPGDVEGARAAALRLASDGALRERLGAAGRQAAETTYNRRMIAERLDAFLRSLLVAS